MTRAKALLRKNFFARRGHLDRRFRNGPDRRGMTSKTGFDSTSTDNHAGGHERSDIDVFGSLILSERERDYILNISSVGGSSQVFKNTSIDTSPEGMPVSAVYDGESIREGSPEASDYSCYEELKASFGEPVDAFALLHGLESRTTVMFRRVPRRMTSRSFQDAIEALPGLGSSVEFIYLPRDNVRKSNRGFAFVNFFNPVSLAILATMLSNRLTCPATLKNCMMFFARIQGSGSQLSQLIDSAVKNKMNQ